MYTVDIDIGGTLTDGLVSDATDALAVKVDTTPHDFTVCFFDCLREAATELGFTDIGSFLDRVAVIRWSSTISTNVLAERKGPRIGLLGSPGMGTALYGPETSPAVDTILDPSSITEVALPLQREEVLTQVRALLEQGVRRVCVSLQGAYADPGPETDVKQWVADQYPDHFLGAVPVLAGTDMIVHPDDRTRTHMALVNAYVHTPLAVSLFKAEEELMHLYGYRRPLYIGHVSGGVARVAKTKGFDTLESGPVFGISAGAYSARRYGHDRVLALDVGGTTAKLGVILDGRAAMAERTDMFGIPLETPWILLRSVALGGGSVARAGGDDVVLGPESMGAFPGPACYNLGGDRATLTDAFVVCGLLDPARFLGGRRRLDVEAARGALRTHVAEGLGIDVAAAARRVVDAALVMLERAARAILEESGRSPDGFHLYGFGGNGALLGPGLAERLGLGSATVFRLGHVFSALGSSVSDICHVHEEYPEADLTAAAAAADLAARIAAGTATVRRDLEGEQADAAVSVTVEATVSADGTRTSRTYGADGDPGAVAAGIVGDAAAAGGPAKLVRLAVRGAVAVPRFEPEAVAVTASPADPVGERPALWRESGAEATDVYDWEKLEPGAHLGGPAVIEAGANTSAVPPGWRLDVDGFGNGSLTREVRR